MRKAPVLQSGDISECAQRQRQLLSDARRHATPLNEGNPRTGVA
ncbi:hypothetical protein [Nostoc sp.]|nr:hypothetical protein [Nostoc sp. S13]